MNISKIKRNKQLLNFPEKSWVHASEGYDIELACIIHGDVTSDVSTKEK